MFFWFGLLAKSIEPFFLVYLRSPVKLKLFPIVHELNLFATGFWKVNQTLFSPHVPHGTLVHWFKKCEMLWTVYSASKSFDNFQGIDSLLSSYQAINTLNISQLTNIFAINCKNIYQVINELSPKINRLLPKNENKHPKPIIFFAIDCEITSRNRSCPVSRISPA